MSLRGDHEHGAAWRRRQRRLRMHWRHEQLTLQMLLATYEHHAAPRGQMKARSGEWERAVLHGHVPDHPTPQAAGTEYFSLDVKDVPVAGSRPDRLAGVRPQERVQQHLVDQIVDTAPALPILDVPVPLMGEQVVDVLRFFDTLCPVAEQVIDVPKISLEDIPTRTPVRDPQLVEQLVEVPTILNFLKQKVDIPVPGRGSSGCLLGSLPEQRTTALHVAQERISERIEQIDAGGDFPSRRAGPRVFRPRQRSAAAGAEQLADIVSHGPDHVVEHLPESVEWVQLRDEATSKPYFWNRRTRETKWKPPPGIRVVWVGEKGSGAEVWYWHKGTRASTYDLPPLPPE